MDSYDDLLHRRLQHLDVSYDQSSRAIWVEFKYNSRPCFTTALIDDVRSVQHSIRGTVQTEYQDSRNDRLLYQVLASTDRRVFNLGGDLSYFIELIEAGDRESLYQYARTCVDIQYATITHYDIPFTTIAVVEGEALGGGFEAALSANVLVAEPRARFGFPEICFGMFPGMGALSLLIRKITPGMARRLIMDHRIYTANELYDLGVIDVLVPEGQAREAVIDYMRRRSAMSPGVHGFQNAVERAVPVSYDELIDVVDIWVDTALQLSEKNRRLMAYFARAQSHRYAITESLTKSDCFHLDTS